ncbi:LADA_0C12662g1_1 [Lachancea dasiensis]|uniref:Sm protein F n=1 Tax=Lachancea dasiensis TaxID=1072105 RepID=A0A1G4J2E0_9SACH|nr:LADA_0C12662g1_1 [Lachancea dasiensis]
MSHHTPVNPKPFLRDLISKKIVVTLKFNKTQYKGLLVSTDNYFNLQLSDAEEFIDSQSKGKIGDIFIRCNNVLWIGQDVAAESNEEVKATEEVKGTEDVKSSAVEEAVVQETAPAAGAEGTQEP